MDAQLVKPELKSPWVIVAHRCPDHAKKRSAVSQFGGRALKMPKNNRASMISIMVPLVHIIATLMFSVEVPETLIPDGF